MNDLSKFLLNINRNLRYKPSFREINILIDNFGPNNELILKCYYVAPDADNINNITHFQSIRYLDISTKDILTLNESDILKSIRKALIDIEIHEVDEWLSFNNKRIFYPHNKDDFR